MNLSRRQLFQLGGATTALIAAGDGHVLGADAPPPTKVRWAEETATICPYCAVGCGMIVSTVDGKVVNTEGDPDHPINCGALCSKGSTLSQLVNSDRRITQPMYRAPASGEWQTVD